MYRIGHGFDVHQLTEHRDLMLGGIKIPHSKGEKAHSDGDVVLHALCDALLGALSLGDIGKLFPDTDNAFKNIDSKILLSKCYGLVKTKDYTIVNADLTLLLEKPKVAPFRDSIRESIASVLETDIDNISFKATTTESLGFVGREEGVSCYATILLRKNG